MDARPVLHPECSPHLPPSPSACSFCSRTPMDQPFEGPCGHLACFSCWHSQVARSLCCATCKKPARRGQLVKKHFL